MRSAPANDEATDSSQPFREDSESVNNTEEDIEDIDDDDSETVRGRFPTLQSENGSESQQSDIEYREEHGSEDCSED